MVPCRESCTDAERGSFGVTMGEALAAVGCKDIASRGGERPWSHKAMGKPWRTPPPWMLLRGWPWGPGSTQTIARRLGA